MANTIVTMTSPEGATLNTAGTYCENDIEVVPKLQEKTATTGEVVTPDAGYAGLSSVDTTPVFEAGQKSEYDAFWDDYQTNGNRIQYFFAFAGYGWTNNNFRPKYDIRPDEANRMFSWTRIVDIYSWLDSKGLVLDFSNCTDVDYAFEYSRLMHLRVLDFSKANRLYITFGDAAYLKTIEKLVLKETQTFTNAFHRCYTLTNLTIEGTIGQNGYNVSWSPLNKASLTSIVNALSSTTTGLTVTLRFAAVNTAFETSAGAADGSTSEEWLALAATKPNWNISLINS